jgi:hypothetical protein
MEYRLRGSNGEQDLAAKVVLKDELDDTILDNVAMAGERFNRMSKVLIGA